MTGATLLRFGRARIQPLVSGNYRPSDDGQWAIVLGVQDRFDEIVDLVAWWPDDPGSWWLRHGDEVPLLGARALAFAADERQPIMLLPTPEAWLFAVSERSEERVVCVLDWGVGLGPLFDGVSRVECQGPDLQKRFQRTLRAWEPKITAARQGASRAA